MESTVSIIVPVYNVEKYIDKCMNSIVNQTYSKLEIILVDDGATDNSGKICDEWQKKDSRIKVIHQKNGGLAHARNEGMKLVSGNYVLFVDSDDWIDKDMVEVLLNGCVKNNAEVAICRYREIYKDHIIDAGTSKSFVCSGEEALRYHIFELGKRYCFGYEVWNKLYKKEVIEELRFPKGKHFEDIGYTSRVLSAAKKVYYIDEAKYNYVKEREGSILNLGFTERRITDELVLLDKEIEFFNKQKLEKYVEYCTERLMKKIYIYYWGLLRNKSIKNKKECIQILKQLHDKHKHFYYNKKGKCIKKIEVIVFPKIPVAVSFCYIFNLKMNTILRRQKRLNIV